jgi:hypothetical protein
MNDSLADVESEVRAEMEAEDVDEAAPLGGFVGALREANGEGLRAVARYDGERRELLYLREDVAAGLSEKGVEKRLESLVMRALGDPQSDAALPEYGALDATVRWFEDAVVAVYPTGEWSGVIATFDRRRSPLVDAAFDHLG